jgi:hypothetical protein
MKTRTKSIYKLFGGYALGVLLLAMFGTGCSLDSSEVTPVSSSVDLEETSWGDPCELGPEYCYPPLPENGPAPGWSYLRYTDSARDNAGSLDDPPTIIVRRIRGDQQGVFYLDGHQLIIPAGAIPGEELVVSMSVPEPGVAVVDFGPHGTQFNTPVTLRMSIEGMDLPEGLGGEDMTIWYINDDGEYILFEGTVHSNGNWLETTTDHFSRYIIAARFSY